MVLFQLIEMTTQATSTCLLGKTQGS